MTTDRIKALEDALRPFAFADAEYDDVPDDAVICIQMADDSEIFSEITMRDLRRAAQADYEARILAALDLTTAPAVEPRTVIGGDASVAVCPICDIAWCQHVRGEAPVMKPVALTYTNWRGQTAVRRIVPLRVWFGSTAWHPDPQWLLTAIDMDKGWKRDFALAGFGQPVTAQDAAQDVELLLSAYKGLLVLHRIMVKSGLHAGEKTTSELADRIVAAHPEFPARAALRAIGGDA